MAKRNISYIKPEDPAFLKALKKEAGYDDKNHKFDELQNAKEDFVEDGDEEQPQIVVLKKGDLTAEEAALEKSRLEKEESETKADLSQRVIFNKSKKKCESNKETSKKRKINTDEKMCKNKKSLLSFNNDDDDV